MLLVPLWGQDFASKTFQDITMGTPCLAWNTNRTKHELNNIQQHRLHDRQADKNCIGDLSTYARQGYATAYLWRATTGEYRCTM